METYSEKFRPADSEDQEAYEPMYQIFRGEVSAIQAYTQAIEKIRQEPEITRLQEYLTDHRKAVTYWKDLLNIGAIDTKVNSGPWGRVVEAIVGSAKLLGVKATLVSLQEGEEHGLKQYRDLLSHPALPPDCKQQIREVFIPAQERHIDGLQALRKKA